MTARLTSAFLAFFLLVTGFSSVEARGLRGRDLAMLERVSDPRLSPDGRYLAYSVRTTDWEANKGVNAIWLIDLQGRRVPRRLTASDGGAVAPRWSANGRWLYFLSSRSKSSQVWRTDIVGRTAVQVTDLRLDVGAFRLSPDGTRMAVSVGVFPDCGGDEIVCTRKRLDETAARKASGVVHDRLFVRLWDEWANGTRNHLFVLGLDDRGNVRGEPISITRGFDGNVPIKPFGDDGDFVFTLDGEAVVFAARTAGTTEAWNLNYDLWRAPTNGSQAPQRLTASNPAMDLAPAMSPDGRQVAFLASRHPGREADRLLIRLLDLRTGTSRDVAPGWDRSPDRLIWSADGRTLYASAEDVGQKLVFAVDIASGRVTPFTGGGTVAGFDVARDSLVFVRSTLTAPPQVFRRSFAGGPEIALTDHNASLLSQIEIAQPEPFSFKGWNGETVHGHVVKPVGYVEGRRYPVAYIIHGGPQSSFANAWSFRWNPQTYAAAGYGVVFIDYHGSTGYGQAFTDSVSGHWGDRPLEDFQKSWAYVLKRYPFLDGSRACALGPSVGGYMINWIAGNWNEPWKCLVNHAGLFDLRSISYSTEEISTIEREFGGRPYQNPEAVERFNPIRFVKNWRVPTLVIHGGQDFRVPLEQGLGVFSALQQRGVPSKLLYFPDENHWVLKPQNSVQWHDEVEAWLARWTAPAGQSSAGK